MSKRFLRWIDAWIEDNVRHGEGGDLEPYAVRAARIAERLLADAAAGGFRQDEIDDERQKIPGLIETYLATKPEFDISGFGAAPPDD
ncbi:MAG: DUF768 domain-containing protein [Bauldia sp.]|nr:DUF768 domain-containing protein [Bauldia sp.]